MDSLEYQRQQKQLQRLFTNQSLAMVPINRELNASNNMAYAVCDSGDLVPMLPTLSVGSDVQELISDDLFMYLAKSRAQGCSWAQISSKLRPELTETGLQQGDSKRLEELFQARLADIGKSAKVTPTPGKADAVNQFLMLQELVKQHGEDWPAIAAEIGIRSADLEQNWRGYSVSTQITREWTCDETATLALCRKLGVSCRASALIIGTKLPLQCRRKTIRPNQYQQQCQKNKQKHKQQQQQKQVQEPQCGETTYSPSASTWSTGHIGVLHITQPPCLSPQSVAVTAEAERQYRRQGRIDWLQVALETRVSMRSCLEVSRCTLGMRSWEYDASTFDWQLAEDLRQFILRYYPPPCPIDFNAVSNYLRIDLNDCLELYGLLSGRFDWDATSTARLAALVESGMSDAQIARELSPVMPVQRVTCVRQALMRRQQGDRGSTGSLVSEMSHLIAGMIPAETAVAIAKLVHEYLQLEAGADDDSCMPIHEMVHSIRQKALLSLPGYHHHHSEMGVIDRFVLRAINEHPLGPHKISPRRGTSQGALQKLHHSEELTGMSAKWTADETRMLHRYVEQVAGDVNWKHFASILGTKTPMQCGNKYRSLRRNTKRVQGTISGAFY
ncbi:hypothetical protein GGI07_004352 [Coemansia sp. Benny D115]|nr:hypothetical protein GGI07_004352 [Coemansia sp. Benny D115]